MDARVRPNYVSVIDYEKMGQAQLCKCNWLRENEVIAFDLIKVILIVIGIELFFELRKSYNYLQPFTELFRMHWRLDLGNWCHCQYE